MMLLRLLRAARLAAALVSLCAALPGCAHHRAIAPLVSDLHPAGSVLLDLGAVKRQLDALRPARPVDDWTMYAHDAMRSAYQPQNVGITRTNLSRLRLAWRVRLDGRTKASPIVAGGLAYFATQQGTLFALDAATGRRRWSTVVAKGEDISMTPTLAAGEIFLGSESGTFAAVDARSGKIVWKLTLPGARRGEPVVVGSDVIEGQAGGDPPDCVRGGVDAFDVRTGAVKWRWNVSDLAADGGSVWSPLAFDGRHLFFGTGNTCHHIAAYADALISLTPEGRLVWASSSQDSRIDDDLGSAAQRFGNVIVIPGKDGTILAVDAASGRRLARRRIPYAVDGFGSIGAPASDGTTLVVTGGSSDSPAVAHITGSLAGFDRRLEVTWKMRTPFPLWGYVALADGIGFTTLGAHLAALDPETGRVLWSAPLATNCYASPAVVPSGIYAVDYAGNAYAFREPVER